MLPPEFEPRSRWQYGNHGFIPLGRRHHEKSDPGMLILIIN